jgi:phenylalanyl-tRNA synthetase beta chain
VFEAGKVYLPDPAATDGALAVGGFRQPLRIAGAAFGPALEEQWGAPTRNVDFYDVKADVETLIGDASVRFVAPGGAPRLGDPEVPAAAVAPHPALHPGRSARIERAGAVLGWIGELHPRLVQMHELPSPPVVFELEWAPLQQSALPRIGAVSRFPPVRRDLAVVVGEAVPAQALVDAMRAVAPAFVATIRVFDVYRGANLPKGRKSLAFLVVMQDTERTLTDAEIDAAMEQLMRTLQEKFDGTAR